MTRRPRWLVSEEHERQPAHRHAWPVHHCVLQRVRGMQGPQVLNVHRNQVPQVQGTRQAEGGKVRVAAGACVALFCEPNGGVLLCPTASISSP